MNAATPPEAERLLRALHGTRTVVEHGRVVQAGGTILRATGLRARIGQQCRVFDASNDNAEPLIAEVIGFAGAEVILAPYGPLQGIAVGAAVQAMADVAQVPYGEGLLGRVIDPFGRPLDDRPLPEPGPTLRHTPLHAEAPSPLKRKGVDHRRARDRCRAHRRRRPARGHLRDGRRRQVDAAGHAGPPGQGRRQRDRAGRRARPRSA
jgi:type III secretion protein N (ATPase)